MVWTSSLATKCYAEFAGTFLLVLTVGCNVLGLQWVWSGVSIGAVLTVAVYALGGVSGANFNPAVSVALGLSKSMGGAGYDWRTVGIYCACQCLAGILAGACYTTLYGESFNLMPAKGFGWLNAGLVELIYTFMLCFVVLNVAAAKKNVREKNQYFGLATGLVLVAGIYGAGEVSGGTFNPALAVGVDVSSMGLGFGWCIAYTFFQLLGAVLATFAFAIVRPEDFREAQVNTVRTKFASEFIGTFMLVLTVGLNVLGRSKAPVYSIAAALTSMIYAVGDISGGHLNPAVTLAFFLSKRDPDFTPRQACLYVAAQVAAGIAAGLMTMIVYVGGGYAFAPVGKSTWSQVIVGEIVFTFLLVFTVLCVAVSPRTRASHMFGFIIGSCVTVGGLAVGGISGGAFNPAVVLGMSASALSGEGFGNAVAYVLLEVIGALAAVGVFKVTHDVDLAPSYVALDPKFGGGY